MIKKDVPYFVSSIDLGKIKEDEWPLIDEAKKSYLITNEKNIEFLKYPGFVFSKEEDAKKYNEYYDKHCKDIFTPPRGNLNNTTHVFCGIKPGHYYASLSKSESSWLFGPSTKLLIKLLFYCKIYPYLTNIYKSHYYEMNKNYDSILEEIKVVNSICKSAKLIFLGNYDEYIEFTKILKDEKVEIECYRIWHPAYIARNNSEDTFNRWKNQLLELRNRL